ncbi:hypothetical protein [Sulfitobacter noctilucicola]|uniref:hypothetical protein n=1 Tax=Sulfitobacter noctilucicola TaxID=1342301 RepID=UPI001F4CC736|nr:hypothetical protein [Sulfitobacter noctilucicola]
MVFDFAFDAFDGVCSNDPTLFIEAGQYLTDVALNNCIWLNHNEKHGSIVRL